MDLRNRTNVTKFKTEMRAVFCMLALAAGAAFAGESVDLMKAPVILRGSSFRATHHHVNTQTETYYSAINDGKAETAWEPMEARGPHFIEMLWNQPVRAFGAQLSASGVGRARLSRWLRGDWQPVATFDGEGKASFAEAASDRWRLDFERQGEAAPRVAEFSLFGPEQYVLPAEIPSATEPGRVELSEPKLPAGPFRPGDEVEVGFRVSAPKTDCGYMIELSDREALDAMRDAGSDFCSGRWAAKADSNGWVSVRMELPPWTPQGRSDILVTALADGSGRRIRVANPLLGSIDVARPDFPPMLPPARTVGIGENTLGQRGFVINGEWHPPFFNRYYGHPTPERLAATAKTGLKILYWQNRDCMPLDERGLEARIAWFDQRIRMALRINPQNYFILSQVIKATDGWLKKHPDERMLLENGEPNPRNLVSFGSELYLRESERFVERLADFVARQPYGDRVIGYHLWTCTQNDCFIGGAQQNSKMTNRADFVLGDYHPGALRLFRAFLRKKYRDDVASLRKAWHDARVTFEDATVRRAELVREDFPGSTFRDPVRSRPAIDYLEFFPTMIGRYNRRIAATVKRVTGGRALTMVHAGAVKGYLCYAWAQQLQSNNNDLADLLNDPNVDVFVQAQPYDTREAGNALHVYPPVRSLDLHGKLYLFDHDHRTLGAGVLKYGRHRSQYESASVFPRDYGYQWIENAGAWISDMSLSRWWSFNEYRLPWYTMPEVVKPIRDSLAALQTLGTPRKSAAEIVAVVSLASPRYEDACHAVPHYKGLVNDCLLQNALPFLGAPHDVILASDLARPDLPEYKLYLFVNPTYFTPAERTAIDGLKRDGKTLAWFYAPGYATDEGLSLAAAKGVCGIGLGLKQGEAETPELIYRAGSPLADGLAGQFLTTVTWFGLSKFSPVAVSPIFFADDPAVVPAGLYADGKVAYGHRDFGTWKSVWCGVPNFDLPALVNLARFAGVHLYAQAPVVLNADNRMMMLHNGYGEARTVRVTLPRPAAVGDLLTGRPLADGAVFDVRLDAPETRLLRLDYK